jgi:hypothetical protein
MPDEERVGLDDIRGPEDLGICVKFQLEVYYEGKTEAVWAAEHAREYERLQRPAGLENICSENRIEIVAVRRRRIVTRDGP